MHLAIWIIVGVCTGLWTLLAWGLAAVIGADPAWVGELRPFIERVPFGDLLDIWIPGWQTLAANMLEMTQASLGWLGAHAGWAVWGVWALGALMMVGTGGLLSLIVSLVAKTPAQTPKPAA